MPNFDDLKEYLTPETENAISDLKELNAILTEIRKTDSSLSESRLAQIVSGAFGAAGQYGRKAADYLAAVQEASRAGYEDAEGIARLSLAVQNTGSMTADLATQYIAAADNAYRLGGSISSLTEILDGASAVSSSNAVDMAQLAEGMANAAPLAASLGVNADEAAAALATLIAAAGQGGTEAAESLKSVLTHIREISSAGNPMDTLREWSETYPGTIPGGTDMSALMESMDGTPGADALKVLVENYDMYEKMLQDYAGGAGTLAAQAELSANSWEGSLNRLSNAWAETLGNIITPETVTAFADGLNGVLSIIARITEALGPIGSAGLTAGLLASFKDVGRDKTYSPSVI